MNNSSVTLELLRAGPVIFAELYWWCDSSSLAIKIMGPLVLVFGVSGNVLSFITVTRKGMRKMHVSFILAVLAVADTAVLIFSALLGAVRTYSNGKLDLYVETHCSLMYYLNYFFSQLSAFLMALIAAERFIAVYKPLKAGVWLTTSRIGKVILAWVVFLAVINTNAFFVWGPYGQVSFGSVTLRLCTCWGAFCSTYIQIWPMVDALLYSWGPSCVIVILNVLTFSKLLHRYIKRRRAVAPAANANNQQGPAPMVENNNPLPVPAGPAGEVQGKTIATTSVLLSVNAVYLICSMPVAISSLYLDVWFENVKAGRATICDYVNWYIWVGILLNINHAINFYLYCLVGSKFRRELKRWFVLPRNCNNIIRAQ